MAADEEKAKLIQTLTESERIDEAAQEEGQRIVNVAQEGRDYAKLTRRLVEEGTYSSEQLRALNESWQARNDAGRTTLHNLRETHGFYGPMSGTAFATSTSVATDIMLSPDLFKAPNAQKFAREFAIIEERKPTLERVQCEMVRCGLHRERGGRRSPLDLLNESALAIDQPSSLDAKPTGALIPLRGAIERAVLDLFDRCHGQEEASGWSAKVQSIGKRAGRAGLSEGHFERISQLVHESVKRLSGEAKDRPMERWQVKHAHLDGLRLLASLLESMDEAKLRS